MPGGTCQRTVGKRPRLEGIIFMPLPDNLELQTPQTKDWPVMPADIYQCEITDIEYKEIDNKWKQKPDDPDKKQVMNFEFTVIEEGEHYGRKLWQMMAPTKPLPPKSNGKASWIWRIASALAAKPLTYDEGESYTTSDINGFIHQQIRVVVSQSEPKADGKQYNNIDGFLPVKQKLPLFDEKKVTNEAATKAVRQDPVTSPADEVSPAKAAMQRGMEKHQAQQEMDDEINVEDIPF